MIDNNHFDGGSLVAWKVGDVLLTPSAIDVLKDGRGGYLAEIGLDGEACKRLWKALQEVEIAHSEEIVMPGEPLPVETEQTLRAWLAEQASLPGTGAAREYLPLLTGEDIQAISDAMDVLLTAKASPGSNEVTSSMLDALRAGGPSMALWSMELLGEGKLPFSIRAILAGKDLGRYLPIKQVSRPGAKGPLELLTLCIDESLSAPAAAAKRLAKPVSRRALRKSLLLSELPASFRERLGAE